MAAPHVDVPLAARCTHPVSPYATASHTHPRPGLILTVLSLLGRSSFSLYTCSPPPLCLVPQAGLIPAVLSLLERSPSSLTYWLPLNMGVSGVRLLELQRWLLGEQGV